MKTNLSFSLIFMVILFSFHAQAQFFYGGEFSATVSFFDKAEAPFADPTFVEGFERATGPGFELGVPVEYWFTETLAVSSGLFFVGRGGGYKTKNPNVIWVNQVSGEKERDAYNWIRYKLGYFEVPLMVKTDLFEILKIAPDDQTLRLSAGVLGMGKIASRFRYNNFEESGSEIEESWESEKLEGANSFVAGWEAKVEWTGSALVLYGSFSKNITEVYDTSQSGFENYDVNMSTVKIGMGFLIGSK